MNQVKSSRPKWLTKKRMVCFALIIAATIYTLLQPKLEEWTGLDLPDLGERQTQKTTNPSLDRNAKSVEDSAKASNARKPSGVGNVPSGFRLERLNASTVQSPAGLQYSVSNRENRIDHVMRHAVDDPDREFAHGVFSESSQDEILKLLDNAYELIETNSNRVKREPADEKGRVAFTIRMPEEIGYVGGKSGSKQGFPKTDRLKMVLEGRSVITAYPTWPKN